MNLLQHGRHRGVRVLFLIPDEAKDPEKHKRDFFRCILKRIMAQFACFWSPYTGQNQPFNPANNKPWEKVKVAITSISVLLRDLYSQLSRLVDACLYSLKT
uniref:Uncharacterized protein n=1 Tax=Castor canadensis TaxID=51338 RepID=A0A8C0W683_CASCN